MANILSEENKQQVVALGRLGWTLRRIQAATGVRRETAGAYLRAAGIAVRSPGGRPSDWPPKPATTEGGSTDPPPSVPSTPDVSKPATTEGVSTDPAAPQW